jgi:hypothetical protein
VPWTVDPTDAAELGVDPRTLCFGSYLHLRRGLRYADGSTELVELGRLRIDAVAWQTIAASASLELADRMAQVADTMIVYVYDPTGKTAQQAIGELVTEAFWPTPITVRDTSTPGPLLKDSVYHDDRATALQQLAAGVGVDCYFNALGELVLAPIPDPPASSSPYVWTIDAGDNGVMIDTDEGYDRADAINGVFITGIGAWDQSPFQVLFTDSDPASPTVWGGPYGKVAASLQLTSIIDFNGITAAAAAYFKKHGGLSRTLQITSAPNPALDAGDVMRIVYPDGSSELVTVSGLRIPLDAAQPITVQTKSRYGLFKPPTYTTPQTLTAWQGAQAWRELRDATLVEA